MVKLRQLSVLTLLPLLAFPLMAQERTWTTLSGSEFRPLQERGSQGYNPWRGLSDQSTGATGIEPRFVERPRRQFQASPQPTFPAPQHYWHLPHGHHWGGPSHGGSPGMGHHGVPLYGQGYHPGLYSGLGHPGGLYPGLGHGLVPHGFGYPGGFGGLPGLGFMPWGWMPW